MGSVSQKTNTGRGIADLQRSGAVRRGAAGLGARADGVVATAIAPFDLLLPGGGLPCGHVTELAGPASCGKLGLAARALAGALAAGERAALVDASRSFYPYSPDLVRALARLLVCRVTSTADGLAAAELLAGSGGLALVAVDLACATSLGAAERTAVARLIRAARDGNAAVLVVTEPAAGTESLLGSAAALRIDVTPVERRIFRVEPRVRVARSRLRDSRG